MELLSTFELLGGSFTDRNFSVQFGEIEAIFSVHVDVEFKRCQSDYDSPPEYDVVRDYYDVVFKEAWKGEHEVKISPKQQMDWEEKIEKHLKYLVCH